MRLKAPEGCASASVGGATYEVDETGHIIVEGNHTPLLAHGFTVAAEQEVSDEGGKLTATEVIEKVKAAATVEELDAFAEGETRTTVLDAIEKKRKELAGQ